MYTGSVFAYGRFNPPHKGHEAMFKEVIKVAKEMGYKPVIFITATQNSKKNPLTADEKAEYIRKMVANMGNVEVVPLKKGETTISHALAYTTKQYGENKYLVVGSDREGGFKHVKKLVVPRGPNAIDVSATNVRTAATGGRNITPYMSNKLNKENIKKITNIIQKRMS